MSSMLRLVRTGLLFGLAGTLPFLAACGGTNGEGSAKPIGDEEPVAPVAISPIKNSTIAASLAAIGVDLDNPPSLHELVESLEDSSDRAGMHTLMSSFTKSLGVECSGCHTVRKADGHLDFEADTPERRLASGMWEHFIRGLRARDGTAYYCDSCHQGKAKFLDRSDDQQLATDMRLVFVQQLEPRDGGTMSCATCHGTPMNPEFLDSWKE